MCTCDGAGYEGNPWFKSRETAVFVPVNDSSLRPCGEYEHRRGETGGARLDYELRMPGYEAAHIRNPEAQLFGNLHFRSGTSEARLVRHTCREDSGNLVCTGMYLFERDVEEFDVDCTFASITVPNHVHLLRAVHGDKSEQAAFDSSFTTTTIRFRPPTVVETAVRDGASGFRRATAGLVQILFLAALVLAGRSRRELVQLTAMFLAGQALTVMVHWPARLQLSPRFIEAATALTIAYLAFEILLLPMAGQRWLVVGVLGLLHGMYFDMLLSAGDYGRWPFLAGAFAGESVLVLGIALLALFGARVSIARRTLVERAMASLLLITGISWFVLRLKS